MVFFWDVERFWGLASSKWGSVLRCPIWSEQGFLEVAVSPSVLPERLGDFWRSASSTRSSYLWRPFRKTTWPSNVGFSQRLRLNSVAWLCILHFCYRLPVFVWSGLPVIQEFKGKGHDAAVIVSWLFDELGGKVGLPAGCDLVATCVELAHHFMSGICGGDDFLDAERQHYIQACGHAFQVVYLTLAGQNSNVWRIRPKFHLLSHLIAEGGRPSSRNPKENGTWMDEDWVKKISRILRRTHKKTSPQTVLQRYLLLLAQKLKRAEIWDLKKRWL